MFFRTFRIIETFQSTDEVTCNTADTFKLGFVFRFTASAFRADIADDTVITADGVTVNRVVDGAVTDTGIVHAADDCFERLEVVSSIAIEFHI